MNKPIILIVLLVLLYSCERFEDYDVANDTNQETTHLVTAEKAARITEEVYNTLNANELMGIQVSIRDGFDESWNASFGATNLKQTNKLENRHILRIGSVTKIFTATLILKLIELDYLDPDQELADFYPEIEAIKGVTIKNLLNHSSGIADVFSIPSVFIESSNFPDKLWNPSHLAKVCMKKKLKFTPGSKHSYSNTNFIILGLVAEKATGRKVPELFADYLINPCQLNSTSLIPYMNTPQHLINGYVHHYALSLKEWYPNEPENTSWATVGFTAGAMASNSTDLSAFTYRLFSGEIVNTESLKLMTTFSDNYGLGLKKIKVNDRYYWGHEGEITGFESITAYHPDSGIVISICCNTTPFTINELLNKIDALLYNN